MGRIFGWPESVLKRKQFGGGATFVGPLDDISDIAACYSTTRRLLTSYEDDLIELRRDSDDAVSDFGYDSNGDLDTAAIATWLSGANGYFRTIYDQGGNGRDLIQTTNANQPAYVASGINSLPTADFDGSSDYMKTAGFTLNQPETVILVLDKTSIATFNDFAFDGFTASKMALYTSSNLLFRSGGVVNTGSLNKALKISSVIFDGASSAYYENGGAAIVSGNVGAGDAGGFTLGARGDDTLPANIDVTEVVLLSVSVPTAHHNTIGQAMDAKYSTGWTNV